MPATSARRESSLKLTFFAFSAVVVVVVLLVVVVVVVNVRCGLEIVNAEQQVDDNDDPIANSNNEAAARLNLILLDVGQWYICML